MDYGYYKKIAKDSLADKWNIVAVCSLIYFLVNALCTGPSIVTSTYEAIAMSGVEMPEITQNIYINLAYSPLNNLGTIANWVVLPILAFGFYSMGYKSIKRQKVEYTTIFEGFKNFGNVFVLYLLTSLYTFLWTLLFIVPGIIKALSYSMSNFILAENPDIKPSDAIKESKKLMDGNKLDLFMLNLSFIGWYILDIFTFGILSIWLSPYVYTTQAAFYEAVKNEKYGDAAPYVYKNMLFKQMENGYYNPQQGAPYGQNPAGYPYQQGAMPYGQPQGGYVPNQQSGAPFGQNPAGYPYQQGAMPYGQPQGGYVPNQQTYSPQGFISDEYGNPISEPESHIDTEPIVAEENSDDINE